MILTNTKIRFKSASFYHRMWILPPLNVCWQHLIFQNQHWQKVLRTKYYDKVWHECLIVIENVILFFIIKKSFLLMQSGSFN